jgi:hypothetical protein
MTALPLSLLDLDDEDYVGGFQRSSKPTLLTSIDNLSSILSSTSSTYMATTRPFSPIQVRAPTNSPDFDR